VVVVKLNPFTALRDQACAEAYAYFDRHIRRLPRGTSGNIDPTKDGFGDNDVDAFRHAYVSGVITQVYGENAANLLGIGNEYSPESQISHSLSPRSRNMDLWNNRVGRKYGKRTKGRKTLLKLIHDSLMRGELMIDLRDSREFVGRSEAPKRLLRPVISLSKSESGRNERFYDLLTRSVMNRIEFVALIKAGKYRGYSIKLIGGVETPVSKHDNRRSNNIG
jgi:hypothetical protein